MKGQIPVGKATTFIEINGRRYNPATGELIGTAAASSSVIKDIKRVKPAAAQQVALAPQPVAATPLPVRPAPTTKAMDVHRRPVNKPARHHQQQTSKNSDAKRCQQAQASTPFKGADTHRHSGKSAQHEYCAQMVISPG